MFWRQYLSRRMSVWRGVMQVLRSAAFVALNSVLVAFSRCEFDSRLRPHRFVSSLNKSDLPQWRSSFHQAVPNNLCTSALKSAVVPSSLWQRVKSKLSEVIEKLRATVRFCCADSRNIALISTVARR